MKKLGVFLTVSALALAVVFTGCQQGGEQKSSEGEAEKEKAEKAEKKEKESKINQLTEAEKEEGWKLLFDGEEPVEGWRGYQLDSFPAKGWEVDNNAIRCIGSGHGEAGGQGGDIIYDQKFKNFKLRLQYKISKEGNSGIFYLAKELEDEPIWKSAPEFQVLDNKRHPDAEMGKNGNRKAASLYDMIPADPQNTKPAGEAWNQVEIMVYNGTVVHKQNGETVVEYHLGTPDWKEMIKNSKFSDFEEFGKYRKGYIGLQDHGCDVWYRDIKIKKM